MLSNTTPALCGLPMSKVQTSRRWAAAAVALAIPIIAIAGWTAASADEQRPERAADRVVYRIAHRGSSVDRPENTLPAILKAIDSKATVVEVDVRTSQDGELVLLHDATLDRTTNGRGKVNDFKLVELKGLDAGGWFDERYRGERIPTLSEALDLSRSKIKVLLDLKESGEEYSQRVADCVHKHFDSTEILVGIRSVAEAERYRKLLPKATQIGFPAKPEEIEAFGAAKVDIIRLWQNWVAADPKLVERVAKTGAGLHLNGTTGLPEEVGPLLKLRPVSLSSDDPAQLVKSLAESQE